jgi:hypothetical protein
MNIPCEQAVNIPGRQEFFKFWFLGGGCDEGRGDLYVCVRSSALPATVSFDKPVCAFARQTNNSSAVYRRL